MNKSSTENILKVWNIAIVASIHQGQGYSCTDNLQIMATHIPHSLGMKGTNKELEDKMDMKVLSANPNLMIMELAADKEMVKELVNDKVLAKALGDGKELVEEQALLVQACILEFQAREQEDEGQAEHKEQELV